jgi:hypothetical protein
MEPEITELEYVEQLIEDFDLSTDDTIRDLLEALAEDDTESDEDSEDEEVEDAA